MTLTISLSTMSEQTTVMFNNLVSFLSRFMALTANELDLLKEQLTFREYPKKFTLISEGETEQYLYFVSKGLIHQYFLKDSASVTTDLVAEGTITGSVASFLSGKPSHYFLETMEPAHLISISRQNLSRLYAMDKKWQRFGRILITHFLLQQERHILDNVRYSVRERMVHFAEEFPELMKRAPQRKLASYLDIKPETFSRLKKLLNAKQKNHHAPKSEKK
ncbi:MAG: Crp/Fnr family transcriptional regulator [Bacteroidetes bacterium]|nr:Crp/Fnr family transcriptional regulator [Bacteroidota bacterium]